MARPEAADAKPFIAIGMVAVSFFLYAWSAVVVPGVVTRLLLPVLWVAMLVLTMRWFAPRPAWSLASAAVTVAVWFAVMYGGLAGR